MNHFKVNSRSFSHEKDECSSRRRYAISLASTPSSQRTFEVDIRLHHPLGDHIDLFSIIACTGVTYDAPKKWCIASYEDTLLPVGEQLMLAYKSEKLSEGTSMCFHIRASIHSMSMNENIVKISLCITPHRAQQYLYASIECGEVPLSACGLSCKLLSYTTGCTQC